LSAQTEEELEKEKVVDLLVEIGEVILTAKENPVDKAKVTEVDKRLRWARNPEKDPKSAL
jgi:cyclin H